MVIRDYGAGDSFSLLGIDTSDTAAALARRSNRGGIPLLANDCPLFLRTFNDIFFARNDHLAAGCCSVIGPSFPRHAFVDQSKEEMIPFVSSYIHYP